MSHVNLPRAQRNLNTEQLINKFNELIDELQFLLTGHLDVKNIRAKSITADRMDVNELSAIAANLGHITAGLIEAVQIFGSYIATSQGYPKVEFSSSDNLIKASQDANRFVYVTPFSNGSPAVILFDGNISKSLMFFVNQAYGGSVITTVGDLQISSSVSDLKLFGENVFLGDRVYVPNWSAVVNQATGQTLQQAIDLAMVNPPPYIPPPPSS